jgi:ribose 5-phosphate isomerase RpiB
MPHRGGSPCTWESLPTTEDLHDHFSAGQEVEDDHMNIICVGGRTVGPGVAWDLVQTFLAAEFSQAPRHLRRLSKVASLELQAARTNR